MKSTNIFFLCSVILLLSLSFACSNDDDDNDDNVALGECTASWTHDGTDYTKDLVLCFYGDSTLNLSENLTASGTFFLQIDPITATGTYEAGVSTSGGTSVVILLTLNDGTSLGVSSGQVVVTEISNSGAKGTFSGDFFDLADITLTPNFSITNGRFEANF